MAIFRLLHISDLHLCVEPLRRDIREVFRHPKPVILACLFKGHNPFYPSSYHPDRAEAVARITYEYRDRYDLILITGDIGTTGLREDLEIAKRFLIGPAAKHWYTEGRAPTLAGANADIVFLPGNHDRYATNYGKPGGLIFDSLFSRFWPGGGRVSDYVTQKGNRETVAIVMGDFSLVDQTHCDRWPSRYGQGRVLKEQVEEMVRSTESLRERFDKVVVIWATHFPPGLEGVSSYMRLKDDSLLVEAAKRAAVEIILCGHIHEACSYEVSGMRIYCAGTATSVCGDHGHWIHELEIEVTNGTLRHHSRRDIPYDRKRKNFVV